MNATSSTANTQGPLPFGLDGDGDLDALFGSPSLGEVLHAGNPSFPDCNRNGVPDECDLLNSLFDIDGDGLLDACSPPPLMAKTYSLPLSSGGTQVFSLHAPLPGSLYLLLGSQSGTSPGASRSLASPCR